MQEEQAETRQDLIESLESWEEEPSELPHIAHCADGNYRWEYDLDTKHNNVVGDMIMFIMNVIFFPFLMLGLVSAVRGGADYSVMKLILGIYGTVMLVCVGVIKGLSHLTGGHSYMQYEMNDAGIIFHESGAHREYEHREDAEDLGTKTIDELEDGLAAIASGYGNPGYSKFRNVRRISRSRRRNLIWVNSPFLINMIFVPDEAFDEVFEYIAARCPNARITMDD